MTKKKRKQRTPKRVAPAQEWTGKLEWVWTLQTAPDAFPSIVEAVTGASDLSLAPVRTSEGMSMGNNARLKPQAKDTKRGANVQRYVKYAANYCAPCAEEQGIPITNGIAVAPGTACDKCRKSTGSSRRR